MQSQRPPEGGIHGQPSKLWESPPGYCDAKSGNSDRPAQGAQFDAQGRSKTGLEAEIHPYDTQQA